MIIWLDGPCGIGKTTAAQEIEKLFSGCVEVMDADCYFHDMLRQNGCLILSGSRPQNNRIFREKFRGIIEEKLRSGTGHIIVVMTMTSSNSKAELLGYFQKQSSDTLHIVLTASEETVSTRIKSDSRRAGSTAACNVAWFKDDIKFLHQHYGDAIWIDADKKIPPDIAGEIVQLITK